MNDAEAASPELLGDSPAGLVRERAAEQEVRTQADRAERGTRDMHAAVERAPAAVAPDVATMHAAYGNAVVGRMARAEVGADAGAGKAAASEKKGTAEAKGKDGGEGKGAEKGEKGKAEGKGKDTKKGKGKGKKKGEKEEKEEGGGGAGKGFGVVPGDRGAAAAAMAKRRVGGLAKAKQTHEAPDKKVDDAVKAVKAPTKEGASVSATAHVGTMAKAKPTPPDEAASRRALNRSVEAATPKTIKDISSFGKRGEVDRIRGAVGRVVDGQTSGVRGTFGKVNKPPPPVPAVKAVPMPDAPDAPKAAAPRIAAGLPPPVPDSTLDTTEFSDAADAGLRGAGIDQRVLDAAQEGPFKELADKRKGLDKKLAAVPGAARKAELAHLERERKAANVHEHQAKRDLVKQRSAAQGKVRKDQLATKKKDYKSRLSATERINQIFLATKKFVNKKLDGLQTKAGKEFDRKQKQYIGEFKSGVKRDLKKWKKHRYRGWRRIKKAKDWLVGINHLSGVKSLYARNRSEFKRKVNRAIARITRDTNTTIKQCKTEIAAAKTKIQAIVTKLPKTRNTDALAAQKAVLAKFSAMERDIDSRAAQVKKTLDQKRKAAMKAVDKELEKIKKQNQGAVNDVIDAAKKIAKAFGKFLVLARRVTVMGIGTFIKKLLSQAWSGIKNFLWAALKVAFNEWLMEKLAPLKPLLNLPRNFGELLDAVGESLGSLFKQILPALLPGLGKVFVLWLGEQAIKKLVPGLGAISVIIDGIRAAWALVQRLFSAAKTFFKWIMEVANGANVPQLFARALALGLIAALDAIVTFFVFGKLLRKIAGVVLKPFQALLRKLRLPRRRRRPPRVARNIRRRPARARRGKRGKRRKDSKDKRRRNRRHRRIGIAVLRAMKRTGGKSYAYAELRKRKMAQARKLERRYNRKLKRPTRLRISFAPAGQDEKDGDLDFRVHIGPNDFNMSAAVEAAGKGPRVGAYARLRSSAKKGREAHHVPPKGVLKYVVQEAQKAQKALLAAGVKAPSYGAKLDALANETEHEKGNRLAAIEIDARTHRLRDDLGPVSRDVWRVHYGQKTSLETEERMGKAGMDGIKKRSLSQSEVEVLRKKMIDAGHPGAATMASGDLMALYGAGTLASTQFFMTELRAARTEEKSRLTTDKPPAEGAKARAAEKATDAFRTTVGRVVRRASRQAFTAVVVALEKSQWDGTKKRRRGAVGQLKGLARRTWSPYTRWLLRGGRVI